MARRDPRFGVASRENFTVPFCSIGRKCVADVRKGGVRERGHGSFVKLYSKSNGPIVALLHASDSRNSCATAM